MKDYLSKKLAYLMSKKLLEKGMIFSTYYRTLLLKLKHLKEENQVTFSLQKIAVCNIKPAWTKVSIPFS